MANGKTISKPDWDRHLAEAYRNLESVIGDINGAVALMEIAADDTVFKAEDDLEKGFKKAAGISEGYEISLLTETQSTALVHSLYSVMDLCRKLHKQYYDGYNEAPRGHQPSTKAA